MAETALERTARALDLIPFISKNPGWSIAELAEKFATTPSQIMKDLEMLFMCGLPGHSHLELIDLEIDEDYVSVRNAQNLTAPRSFNYLEVTALLLGLDSLLNQIIDDSLRSRAISLRKKMSTFLGHNSVIASVVGNGIVPSEIDHIIERALKTASVLDIEYRSSRTDSLSSRLIFPINSYLDRGHLYTIAFCQSAGEMRHFRNDRITSAKLVENLPLPEIPLSLSEKQAENEVVAKLSTINRFFTEENPTIVSSATEEGSHLVATFEINDLQWLAKALISLPGSVEIISPQSFRDLYNSKLDAILDLYR